MAEEILVIPPIRQSLEDLNSAKDNELDPPKTEKSWYLYWQQTGDRVNANTDKLNKLVTYGNHADRPPAEDMPDGALYIEADRNVIYQNINGAWHYLAGTMWGTITPDQRPTDLGVNDGGFHFRGTDDNREFLWSQTAWVEVTSVRYGIHSARPAPIDVADGSVYVESDRGGVIYQQQAGVWKYLAGTMFGTLSPDQRPTDLGVNDGGFDFRGTDQQREFIWSQTAWVEVTGGAQTPWQSNINAAGFALTNASNIVSARFEANAPSGPNIRVLETTGNNVLDMTMDSAGVLRWKKWDSSTVFMVDTTNGHVAIPNLPSSNPGAGSKKLWYDPADSNRVKFAP